MRVAPSAMGRQQVSRRKRSDGAMVVTARATDGSRFVAERARVWLTDDAPAAVTPALPVIDLARGELDRPTAPHIIAAVADALDRGETHYTSRPGIAPLRHALADQLAARRASPTTRTRKSSSPPGRRRGSSSRCRCSSGPATRCCWPIPATRRYRGRRAARGRRLRLGAGRSPRGHGHDRRSNRRPSDAAHAPARPRLAGQSDGRGDRPGGDGEDRRAGGGARFPRPLR